MPSLSELVSSADVKDSPLAREEGWSFRANLSHLVLHDGVQRELTRYQIAEFLRTEEALDEDGYPTERTLWALEKWPWDDAKGWFAFLRNVWHLADWGWHELDEPKELSNPLFPEAVHRYHLSTAGWSGNESLIRAMEANDMLWATTWVQSRRGGHYIFEIAHGALEQAPSELVSAVKPLREEACCDQ
jgi:hypothetical protein